MTRCRTQIATSRAEGMPAKSVSAESVQPRSVPVTQRTLMMREPERETHHGGSKAGGYGDWVRLGLLVSFALLWADWAVGVARAEVVFHRRDHRDQGMYASDRRTTYHVQSYDEATVSEIQVSLSGLISVFV